MQVQGFGTCFAWCNGRAELGHGTFGAVRVAKIITSGDLVAMKTFNGTAARADAMSEADMLTRLNNQHVVRYLGLAEEYEDLMLVLEHCVLGSLEAHNAVWGHAMPLGLAAHSEQPRPTASR